jgi:DNA-binding transcriptional LysR family regulator
MIGGFRAENPGVELEVRDIASNGLCEELARGDIEAAIYGYPEANDERFHYVPLYQERFVIVVAEGHEFAKKNVIQGSDLNGAAYVCRSRCEIYEYARKKFNDNGIFVKPVFRSERDDWVVGMIKAGFGFGFFPEFSVVHSDVVVRPLIEPEFVRTIYLLTVRGRPHSPAVGAFVRQAKAHHWPLSDNAATAN